MSQYIWVGGSPDSKSVDRFNWNVQENWVLIWDGWTNPKPANKIPGPGDQALIGYMQPGMTRSVTSPLLFGGCSASAAPFSSVWPYKNVNGGISFASNSSGFTPTALSALVIGDVSAGTREWRGTTVVSNYPFPVIGGGITSSVIEMLKGCTVEGMNPADWDSILAKRTKEQEKGLFLQVDAITINGDANHEQFDRVYFRPPLPNDRLNYEYWRSGDVPRAHSYSVPTPWNSYSQTENFQNNSLYHILGGVTGYVKHIYLELLDNAHIQTHANNTTVKCTFLKNFVINLKNSNLREFITQSHTAAFIPSKTSQEEMTTDSRVKYVFENCNIDKIVWGNPYVTLVSGSSGGGRFQRASTFTAELKNTNFRDLQMNSYAIITDDEFREDTVSGYAWFRPEYNKTINIPINITGNISGISAFYKIYPKSSTLGVSLTSKISVKNRIYGTAPLIILGPGITLDTLYLGSTDIGLRNSGNTVLLSPKVNITEIITNFGYYDVSSTDSPSWVDRFPEYINQGYIDVFKLILYDRSSLDMRSANRFAKWRLGKISGRTLEGGIIMPPTQGGYYNLQVDSNTRLLNYTVNSGINKRTGNVYTETLDQRPGSVGIE